MRIYLSGSRKDWSADEICRVVKILKEFGHNVQVSSKDINVSTFISISECDAVAMLDDWETCKACKLEAAYADYIGIQCSGWRDYVEVVA